eukprot:TRINITY_DN50306_c0_g1_i2.p1 TRINITY_DN50306_c0_g1~~TRINITY_DN50306_c0_g1_i2.p1  ORF type:complete len:277 (-),score=74.12 TRINITY_DN50306_c0_g1_i2:143-973(-)
MIAPDADEFQDEQEVQTVQHWTAEFKYPITSVVLPVETLEVCIEECKQILEDLNSIQTRDNIDHNAAVLCDELRELLVAQHRSLTQNINSDNLQLHHGVSALGVLTSTHSLQLVTFVAVTVAITEETVTLASIGYIATCLSLFAFPRRALIAIASKDCLMWRGFKVWATLVLGGIIAARSLHAFQKCCEVGVGCWAENISNHLTSNDLPLGEITILVLAFLQEEFVNRTPYFARLATWCVAWLPITAQRLRVSALMLAIQDKIQEKASEELSLIHI